MKYEQFKQECLDRIGNEVEVNCYNDGLQWQIKHRKIIVNYFPSKGTIYVAGTNKYSTIKYSNPEKAILLCSELINGSKPQEQDKFLRNKRKRKGYRREKSILFARNDKCHFCSIQLTLKSDHVDTDYLRKATLEHLIPLKNGGLDNLNNMVLSCEECNKKNV